MEELKNLKVAIVHDFLDTYGGAERVLGLIGEIFPQAPIFTLIYDKEKMQGKFENREIHTSFLQSFPKFIKKRKKYLLPLMPTAPETFDLRDFDLVISSSGAWSKGIVTRLNTIHIAYLHSPMRFAWDYKEKYFSDAGQKAGICKRMFLTYLRVWDFEAAQRPDILIANSKFTQQRIAKYYRRDSRIIYPGVSLSGKSQKEIQTKKDKGGYFLIVSRLSPYKKVLLAVEAFNKMGLPLVIVGAGAEFERIKKIAKKNIRLVGWQSDEKLREYYQNARAFIFPAVDDFGLTAVEAMSFGVPVIALRAGGALEIVKEGQSGEFFDAQTVEVLADGVRRFLEKEKGYDRDFIRAEAQRFEAENFKNNFLNLIKEEWKRNFYDNRT
ncbi:MAG: glycosyltransferase [Candidatus Moraniibacteriota bacterium]